MIYQKPLHRVWKWLLGLVLCSCASLCFARPVDLLHVFRDAQKYDPTFLAAKATLLSTMENLPQNEAALLPDLEFLADTTSNKQQTRTNGRLGRTFYYNSKSYTLTLTQAIIDFANVFRVKQASAVVKQAFANYQVARQDLIIRVSSAYFTVLDAKDTLRFIRAEKKATARQLDQAQQRYKVGLDAITSVYDAKASYDSIVAEEIAAVNDVENAREQLREITGKYYPKLVSLKKRVPLLTPKPNNVEAWVKIGVKQNFALKSSQYAALAAKENIRVNFSNHLPTLDAVGTYAYSTQGNSGTTPAQRVQSTTGALQVALPIYQGGLVVSQTRQAQHDYQKSLDDMEAAYRQTVVSTRQNYNNIISGISKIKADRQAIISNRSSLESTEAAFKVGTRTIVDVLSAQRDLFQAQRNHATDQYLYINDSLELKQAAGILSVRDLINVNRWLHRLSR